MRLLTMLGFLAVSLVACTGHEHEQRDPGLTLSGESGIGVVYKDGKLSPHQDTKLNIHLGGSI